MSKEFAGQVGHETHGDFAGEPGGHLCTGTQARRAARQKSAKFAGQKNNANQMDGAGEPGGHERRVNQAVHAARRPRKRPAGQPVLDTHDRAAGDAPGQQRPETQDHNAGGDPIAGHSKSGAQTGSAGNGAGGGQDGFDTRAAGAAVRATIAQVIEVGRQNSFAIRQRMRLRQATLSHIARSVFGYHTGLKEAERTKAMDAAAKLIKAIAKGEAHPVAPLVLATDAAAAPWAAIERDTEKAMAKMARKLPAYEWVKGVRGFGDLSFARIVAETGDLLAYANPAKVWKRLGLAVLDGKSQRRTRDAEKAVEQGYSPRRRSVSWVAFHSVYLAQSARTESGDHMDSEAHAHLAAGAEGAGHPVVEAQALAAGPYRRIYDAKKSEYLARVEAGEEGWTKLRADRCAKRYAEKRLIRDLWTAWKRDIAGQKHLDAQAGRAGDEDRGGHVAVEAHWRDAAPVAAHETSDG